jgi:hypothetical protein
MTWLTDFEIKMVVNRWIEALSSWDSLAQTRILRGVLEKFPLLQQYALSYVLELNDQNRKLRVFLCHDSQDNIEVRKIYDRLKEVRWIDPWLHQEKIKPGQEWKLEIEKAVDETDIVIICFSSRSVVKESFLQTEIRLIREKSKEKPEGTIFIIPLLLEEFDVPKWFEKWQWINYWNKDWYLKLIGSLIERGTKLGLFNRDRTKRERLIADDGSRSDNVAKFEEIGQEDVLLISETISEKENLMIQVKGDAMKDIGIIDGDNLLLELCEFSQIRDGDLIVTHYLQRNLADHEISNISPDDFIGPTMKFYLGSREISNRRYYVLSNSRNKNGHYILAPALDVQGVIKFMIRSYREP